MRIFTFMSARSLIGSLMLSVIMLGVLLMAIPQAEAKSVRWSQGNLGRLYIGYDEYRSAVIGSISARVDYHAEVINCATGERLADGATVPTGTRLRFAPTPFANTDTFWNGSGYTYDTPYGRWAPGGSVSCNAADYFGRQQAGTNYYRAYVAYIVDQPGVSVAQRGTASLSAPDGAQCQTVLTPGSISPEFIYARTYGRLILSARDDYNRCRTWDSLNTTVTQQVIRFNLNAISSNNPPTPPVISGATASVVGRSETYGLTATDPDNDQIRYAIDWDANGTIDQWTGFGASGFLSNQLRTWPAIGTYSFRALTEDARGARSTWSTYTVTVSPGLVISSCTVSPTSITVGQSATWSVTATGGTAPYTYSWSGTDSLTGNLPSVTRTYATAGNKTASVVVRDATGASLPPHACALLTVNPPPNNPPNRPTINGPTAGTETISYGFDIGPGDDPDNDRVEYGIDWDMDGNVDGWTNLVNSGTTLVVNNSWPSDGSYTFQALTRDEFGLRSGWTLHTITLAQLPPPPPPTPVPPQINASPQLVRVGERATVTWDVGSSDPASCTLTGPDIPAGFAVTPTGGREVVITGESLFRLECADGTAADSVRVPPGSQET